LDQVVDMEDKVYKDLYRADKEDMAWAVGVVDQ
jgi:hypothetical protein